MKFYRQFHIRKISVYVALWFLITGLYYRGSAENLSSQTVRIIPYEEIPIILDLIANQIRDNYRRIITWSGEIDVKINWLWTGAKAGDISTKLTGTKGQMLASILQKAEERTAFAIDADKNFVYIANFREKRCRFLDPMNEANLGIMSWPYSSGPTGYTVIGKPDFLLKATPQSLDRKENKILHRKAIKKPSKLESRTGLYENMDDPRRILMPGGGYIWDHYDKLIKKINRFGKMEFDGYSLKMEEHKEGDIIVYKIIEPSIVNPQRSSPDHYIIKTKIFSSQYGFNIIYWEVASGAGIPLQEFTWEYELVDGVYLPKKVTEKHYRLNGEVAEEKDYTYINNKLNQKISPETFTYKNLGLQNGDKFIDKILDKEYTYQDGELTLKSKNK